MRDNKKDQLQGTLDLLVLRTLSSGGTMHGYAITERVQQVSREVLRIEAGSLYPALHRMEESGWVRSEWDVSDNNRRARFYTSRRRAEASVRGRRALDAPGRCRNARAQTGVRCRSSAASESLARASLAREFDDELRFHFESRVDANLRARHEPREPRAEARRHLGSTLRAHEGMREARVSSIIDGVAGDLRHGARVFSRKPWLSAWSLRRCRSASGPAPRCFRSSTPRSSGRCPFRTPDRLVASTMPFEAEGARVANPMIPELLDVRAASTTLEAISFFDTRDSQINGGAEPARVFAARVESSLPDAGGPSCARAGCLPKRTAFRQPVRRRPERWALAPNFGADPEVVGRSLVVNGLPHLVVGVLPPEFSIDYMTAEPVEIYLALPHDSGLHVMDSGVCIRTSRDRHRADEA